MVFIKGKGKIPAFILLVLMITLSSGCTANSISSQSVASWTVIASSLPPESFTSTPTSSELLAAKSSTVASTETKSTASIPVAEYPDWSTWTRPIERHDLISYDELLAKMPAITPNADASRFTAEDAVAAGVRDGDTFNSIKKKLGEPIAIYDERDLLGLMRYYMYDGVYFSMFKEISEDGGETYKEYRNGEIVMSAVIFGEGIEGPRGIKIGDTFESVMSMYPQDRNYLENEMFYGKYSFSGPAGKVYTKDITNDSDPFSADNSFGNPVVIVLIPDDFRPFTALSFDDNLILRQIYVNYEVFPFG